MISCTINAASKSIILSCMICLYEKLKNYSILIFQRMFFVFYLFCFLSLFFTNILHVMFYTYICYWNTFQYKYIIQITFHVVKQSHARVTSKDLFTLYRSSHRRCSLRKGVLETLFLQNTSDRLLLSLSYYFFAYFRFVSTSFYFMKPSSSFVV